MNIIAMKCPHCSANLEYEAGATTVVCPYCDSKLEIVGKEKPVDYKQSGYDFEIGRIKAREQEAAMLRESNRIAAEMRAQAERDRIQAERNAKRHKRAVFWSVIGWIFVPYVMGTILFCRKCKLKWYWKVAILVGAYLTTFFIISIL